MANRISTMLLLCALAPLSAEAAYYYESQTTNDADRRGGVSTVRGWVDGPKAKVEFQTADPSGLFDAGTYLVSTDAGKTMYLVNPAKRTVSQLDVEQMLQFLGALTNATAGVVKIEFSDFTSEKIAEGPGEPILGMATTRHQHRTGYTMRIAVLGIGQRQRADIENEFWCSDAIDDAGFAVWMRPDRLRTGNAEFDQLIEQEYAVVDCLPLRNRIVTKITGQRGRETTTTMTTEMTALREEAPPPNAFEVPADFETVPFLGVPPEALEAASTQEASETPAPSEGPRRPRLRDLIGR